MPHDIAIRTGTMARLECAATGHPNPQIAWQKDGGTDFPAARERRMHVMPDDDVFFITDVKLDDMGVYSCTAQNLAGSISANATLTVLGSPAATLSVYVWVWVTGFLKLHRYLESIFFNHLWSLVWAVWWLYVLEYFRLLYKIFF